MADRINPQSSTVAPQSPPPRSDAQQIGVHDYESLVALLTTYFRQMFPSYPETDPQNMMQMLGSVAVQINRQKEWEPDSQVAICPNCDAACNPQSRACWKCNALLTGSSH